MPWYKFSSQLVSLSLISRFFSPPKLSELTSSCVITSSTILLSHSKYIWTSRANVDVELTTRKSLKGKTSSSDENSWENDEKKEFLSYSFQHKESMDFSYLAVLCHKERIMGQDYDCLSSHQVSWYHRKRKSS